MDNISCQRLILFKKKTWFEYLVNRHESFLTFPLKNKKAKITSDHLVKNAEIFPVCLLEQLIDITNLAKAMVIKLSHQTFVILCNWLSSLNNPDANKVDIFMGRPTNWYFVNNNNQPPTSKVTHMASTLLFRTCERVR